MRRIFLFSLMDLEVWKWARVRTLRYSWPVLQSCQMPAVAMTWLAIMSMFQQEKWRKVRKRDGTNYKRGKKNTRKSQRIFTYFSWLHYKSEHPWTAKKFEGEDCHFSICKLLHCTKLVLLVKGKKGERILCRDIWVESTYSNVLVLCK